MLNIVNLKRVYLCIVFMIILGFLPACETETTSSSVKANCNLLSHGDNETRTRYLASTVAMDSECTSEIQTRSCDNGILLDWSGTYNYASCLIDTSARGLLTSTDLVYAGGFRLTSARHGDSTYSTLDFSGGQIAFNPANNSLFIVGHGEEAGIAEFEIPEIINTQVLAEFNLGENVLQNFTAFHNTDRVDTGINSFFRVTGMKTIDQKLVVNYYSWYDANGNETDTSVVFQDASNLATTDIYGPYQMNGAAHAGGWLTDIPEYFQQALGGTHISGWSAGSINSRLSIGPSAFILNPKNDLLSNQSGAVSATPVLDFNLSHMLVDLELYPNPITDTDAYLYNDDLQNTLWTVKSNAVFGLIVPNSNTYITFGRAGGFESGLGYKIVQDTGTLCPGPCTKVADDNYNYYWMWNVDDLIKVKNGEIQAYDVRPYEHGQLDLPTEMFISGGTFDKEQGLIYLAIAQGDTTGNYSRPPLYFVYDISEVIAGNTSQP